MWTYTVQRFPPKSPPYVPPPKAFRHSQSDTSSFPRASRSKQSSIATTSTIWTGRRCALSPPACRCPGSPTDRADLPSLRSPEKRSHSKEQDSDTSSFDRRGRTVQVRPAAATSAVGRWRSPPSTAALEDADLTWPDIEVAFGGSDGSGLADTLVAELGFTGIPFTNVKNGCATGGSALFVGGQRGPLGRRRHRTRGRLRQTPARRVRPRCRRTGVCPRATARPG